MDFGKQFGSWSYIFLSAFSLEKSEQMIKLSYSNLEWFVEEVFKTSWNPNNETERVSDDVQPEDDDIGLLDGLTRVVTDHVGNQILQKKQNKSMENLILQLYNTFND